LESTYSQDYYPVNCVAELSKELKSLNTENFEKIVNKQNSQEAFNLKNWWEMYQEVDRLHNASYASL